MPETWQHVRRRRARSGLRRPLQPGRRGVRGRALPARGRRGDRSAPRDPRLQPLRRIRRLGDAPGEADLDLPEARDRDAHRPRRRPPARRRRLARMERRAHRSAPRRSATVERRRREAAGPAADAPRRSARRSRPPPPLPPRQTAQPAPKLQIVDLTSAPNATVVAVQDGRVLQIGHSRRLGTLHRPARRLRRRLHLRGPRQRRAQLHAREADARANGASPVVQAASTHDPAPSKAGHRRQPDAGHAAGQDARAAEPRLRRRARRSRRAPKTLPPG